jgi:hypothetical protein
MVSCTLLSSTGVTATTLESDRPSLVSTATLKEYVLTGDIENAFTVKMLDDKLAADSVKLQLFPKLLIDVMLHVHYDEKLKRDEPGEVR